MGRKYNIGTKKTSQKEQAHPDQVQNAAGGWSFAVNDWKRFERFLIIGAADGTYYVDKRVHLKDNLALIKKVIESDGTKSIQLIRDISKQGRATSNEHAIVALAIATTSENVETRRTAFTSVSNVCRTATDLFTFVAHRESLAGWGRGMRRAISQWYHREDLAYQLIKYQQRDGWSHRDLLRLAHPVPLSNKHQALFRYVLDKVDEPTQKHLEKEQLVIGWEAMKKATTKEEAVKLIVDHRLTWEMVLTKYLKEPVIWEALMQSGLPITALIRNLGRMTANGYLAPFSQGVKDVVAKLTDEALIKKGRVHPINVLMAIKQYSAGQGDKGSLKWTPIPQIMNALDVAFYHGFKTIQPTNKNFMLGVDVSGSMTINAAGKTGLMASEVAACIAMIIARTEPNYMIMGFSSRLVDLKVTPQDSLKDVLKGVAGLSYGSTDLSLPMLHATQHKLDVDVFSIISDGDTWFGSIHPHQALEEYRRKFNPKAKYANLATQTTRHSVGNPNDSGVLEVVGFDSHVPSLLQQFAIS